MTEKCARLSDCSCHLILAPDLAVPTMSLPWPVSPLVTADRRQHSLRLVSVRAPESLPAQPTITSVEIIRDYGFVSEQVDSPTCKRVIPKSLDCPLLSLALLFPKHWLSRATRYQRNGICKPQASNGAHVIYV